MSEETTAQAEEKEPLKAGIYLQKKISSIGTGGTAKTAEYKNFWVTLSIGEHSAVMVLLNDEFRPTPIKETFALETLSGPNWHYIAEGQKRYGLLRPHLDRMAAAPAAPAPAENKPADGNWWSGGSAGSKSAASKKNAAPAKKKGNWWEG